MQNVQLPCSLEFISLDEIIIREDGLMMPTNANDAKALYIELLEKIKKLQITYKDHIFTSRNQFGNAK